MNTEPKNSTGQLFDELQRAHRAAAEISARLDRTPLLCAERPQLESELQASLNRVFALALAYDQARDLQQGQIEYSNLSASRTAA